MKILFFSVVMSFSSDTVELIAKIFEDLYFAWFENGLNNFILGSTLKNVKQKKV
jgi:ssDNA-specific exonuclease RecJ